MASENRPGVVVVQELTETPAAVSAPTLVPVVVGPCFQIVESLNADGSLNSDAKYADEKYNQVALAIPQADLPDPRDNLDEVDVDETQVSARLYFGGQLTTLPRGSNSSTGSSFLKGVNHSAKPAFYTDETAGTFDFSSGGTAGLLLSLAFDIPNSTVTTQDVTVKLTGTKTPSEVADAINAAAGATVAEAIGNTNSYGITVSGGSERVLIFSPTVGASASITIRANGSALAVLSSSIDDTVDHRLEGAGFRGQDDSDGDLTTPWIEWHRGAYKFGTPGTALTGNSGANDDFVTEAWTGLIDLDGDFTNGRALDVTFTGASAVVPLKAATSTTDGDEFWADGRQVGSAFVTKVEQRRFKVGVLNTTLSTFDSSGVPTSAIYTTVEVNTPSHSSPFAPKHAYFVANNLVFGSVTPAGTKASVTGTESGLDPQPAAVYGSTVSATWLTAWGLGDPVLLAGATLTIALTEDGVVGEDVTYNFSEGAGSYSNLAAIASDLTAGFDGVTVSAIDSDADGTDDTLVFKTVKTGSDQSIAVKTTGETSAASNLGISAELTADGKDFDFAEQAQIKGSAITVALGGPQSGPTGLIVTDSFGVHTFDLAAAATATPTDLDALAQEITGTTHTDGYYPIYVFNDTAGLQVATLHFVDAGDVFILDPSLATTGKLVFTTVQGGADVDISLDASAPDLTLLGFTLGVDDTDTGADLLAGTRLAFTLDGNPFVYETDFTTNSLSDAVTAVNETVGGASDIASENLSGTLTLTSSFAGAASAVAVSSTGNADTVLGLSGASGTGTGRPNPDFYIDGSGTCHIGANILRNRGTGVPYSLSSALADLYFDYVGLRLDVTASAATPGLLTFTDVGTMEAAIGPISTENPLALACFLQLQNAPSQTVSALGVSEVTAAAPMGTVTAHAEALNFLESKEVYAIAPLTDDTFVQQLYATHVEALSQPEERGERIAFIWQGAPDRDVDTALQSGTDAAANGTDNSLTLGENPVSAIVGAGVSDVSSMSVADGIYLELVVTQLGSTTVHNYSLSAQSGVVSTFRTSFASGENDDGFYSTATFDGGSGLTGLTYSLRKRGEELVVPGTQIPDLEAVAQAAGDQGAAFANRRVFYVFCDSVDTALDGVVTNVPGYYACAAITAMIAEQAPQQPFTRFSMTGFSKVYGTDDTFSEAQLDTIADGGRYVLINQGGRIASRHQRSTNSTSIEARELSITKAIDYLAKGLRATNRVYIGRFVINPGFIDQLVMSNEGFLSRTVQTGVVNSAALKSVLQDESAPDTVLIEVEVAPAYPCNKIRITIVS